MRVVCALYALYVLYVKYALYVIYERWDTIQASTAGSNARISVLAGKVREAAAAGHLRGGLLLWVFHRAVESKFARWSIYHPNSRPEPPTPPPSLLRPLSPDETLASMFATPTLPGYARIIAVLASYYLADTNWKAR